MSDKPLVSSPLSDEGIATLTEAVKQRIAVSEQEAMRYAQSGDKALADYHAGCQGMGLCILEDIEALRGVRDGRREEPAKVTTIKVPEVIWALGDREQSTVSGVTTEIRPLYYKGKRIGEVNPDYVQQLMDALLAAHSERIDE